MCAGDLTAGSPREQRLCEKFRERHRAEESTVAATQALVDATRGALGGGSPTEPARLCLCSVRPDLYVFPLVHWQATQGGGTLVQSGSLQPDFQTLTESHGPPTLSAAGEPSASSWQGPLSDTLEQALRWPHN